MTFVMTNKVMIKSWKHARWKARISTQSVQYEFRRKVNQTYYCNFVGNHLKYSELREKLPDTRHQLSIRSIRTEGSSKEWGEREARGILREWLSSRKRGVRRERRGGEGREHEKWAVVETEWSIWTDGVKLVWFHYSPLAQFYRNVPYYVISGMNS